MAEEGRESLTLTCFDNSSKARSLVRLRKAVGFMVEKFSWEPMGRRLNCGRVGRDGVGASFGRPDPRWLIQGAEGVSWLVVSSGLSCFPAWRKVREECVGPCAPGEGWG